MGTRPKGKSFSVPSFAAHSARGIIRDPRGRRWAMFVLLAVALLMMVCGSTVLRELLDRHEHPGWFISFWLACAWFSVTALLLALFDLIILRAHARAERRAFRDELLPKNRE